MKREEAELISAEINDGYITHTKPKSISVEMTIHRHATNTDENYGLVSYYHKNPIIHNYVNFKIWLRGKLWRQF